MEPHLKRLSLHLFSSTLSFSGLEHPIQFTGTNVHLLATHVTDWPICVASKCRVQLCMCRRVILWLDKTQEFFLIPEVPDRKKSESVSGMRNKQLHSVWWAFASGGAVLWVRWFYWLNSENGHRWIAIKGHTHQSLGLSHLDCKTNRFKVLVGDKTRKMWNSCRNAPKQLIISSVSKLTHKTQSEVRSKTSSKAKFN